MCAVGFVQASIAGSRPKAGKSCVVVMGHDLDDVFSSAGRLFLESCRLCLAYLENNLINKNQRKIIVAILKASFQKILQKLTF